MLAGVLDLGYKKFIFFVCVCICVLHPCSLFLLTFDEYSETCHCCFVTVIYLFICSNKMEKRYVI